ncbi:iron chelate uptake ABC transporter family permease subunit [Paenibacillus naphthalenovorans]|uniref:iron chelate uptake ABC transporter family permease subunit n=1 Tax=Paenibacillus naphthalenovorans TaxID=162209 RepID=UPI00087FC37D|nr:iron chelate uptake ABC transporter family permease subunit [Paenibacillus naphthalenovorans]SDJ77698.1 iron complex transport system permease protein [Paenibacillus naphthalenovorans]
MTINIKTKLSILAAAAVALIAAFLFIKLGANWGYALPRRGTKVLAMVLTAVTIAFSTMVFQTITNNRILTPSILGLDSLYNLIQTVVIFAFGSTTMTAMNKNVNFVLCVGVMVLFAGVLYKIIFRREGRNVYFLLLVGIIFGTLFQSFSSFMQVLIDPNEYLRLQDKLFASFNNVNKDLLYLSIAALLVIGLYFKRFAKYLDVLSLGKEQAINLGVDYDYVVKRLLVLVAILVSISTALVGPITFLGLLVANVTHQLMGTYRHSQLIVGSMLISIIALVGGQLIVERVFTFTTTVSVVVNLAGGLYFIYLLLKENKS